MAGIYVHLPFCPYVCPYCDFAKWPHRASAARRYLRALHAEIDAAEPFAAETIFFGGGTPNTYAASDVADLARKLRRRFALPRGAEISVEVNPEPRLSQQFDVYGLAGVSRLSIGVQSFVPEELRTLGRAHSTQDVRDCLARAREANIRNVSLDLMFGIPNQSRASWLRSLEGALALEVEHVSTYGLTIEEGTPFAGWFAASPADFPDQDAQAELYQIAIDTLGRAGYEQYEVSNFAKPGFRCRHNENYWSNGEYLGFGVGAASYRAGERFTHTRDLQAYVAAASAHVAIPGESEALTGLAQAGEAVMLALRTAEGVDLRRFRERYAIDFMLHYRTIVIEMTQAGLLAVDPTHVRLTPRGRFIANEVCAEFLAAG